jgi:hypothetical protein
MAVCSNSSCFGSRTAEFGARTTRFGVPGADMLGVLGAGHGESGVPGMLGVARARMLAVPQMCVMAVACLMVGELAGIAAAQHPGVRCLDL